MLVRPFIHRHGFENVMVHQHDEKRAAFDSRINVDQCSARPCKFHRQRIGMGFDQLYAATIAPGQAAGDLERRAFAEIIDRSEEHTSELQSLMRISYAVFCLKKNKHTTQMHALSNY